mgnify:CR=1 FL=1
MYEVLYFVAGCCAVSTDDINSDLTANQPRLYSGNDIFFVESIAQHDGGYYAEYRLGM